MFDLEWNKKWNLYLLLVVSLIYLVAYFSMMIGCVSISYHINMRYLYPLLPRFEA